MSCLIRKKRTNKDVRIKTNKISRNLLTGHHLQINSNRCLIQRLIN